ncbi:MAG: cysteine--tRNA ligase [Candidatus Diapherotrites archaeon]|nr:cysteine--tRNA ligase [Candidatus Diapherotrites archaeon]
MIRLTNTLGGKKETFEPVDEGKVRMYVCGPTVYGPAHIGHARTYIAFDIIRRYFEYRGFKVRFVMNLTDVHDDMIRRANEQGITIFELGEKNIKLFFEDMKALHIKPSDANPRVTQEIPEIIKAVQSLMEKGFAYETDDGVYFEVEKFPDYGKLSGIGHRKGRTGTRVDTDKYEKKQAQDFAVWKKEKPGEPSWDSPWGKGRPGWHIECSVMSSRHLGIPVDIHGGAVDLVFPHHENEIAQSEAAFGTKPFVKYWLHTGFLNVEGQKMSKSLGNFITIPELLKDFDALAFRFFIASTHYSSRINFSKTEMEKYKVTLGKLNEFIKRLQEIFGGEGDLKSVERAIESSKKHFVKEMDDDFNFPNAWSAIFSFESEMNKLITEGKVGREEAEKALAFLKEINSVFEVFSFETQAGLGLEIGKRIAERETLRKEKKFAEADRIRDELKAKGITLLDTPDGVKWRTENR